MLNNNISFSPTHLIDVKIATLIGESESILLNQIIYWISKCGRDLAGQKGKWIYNSLPSWHKQFSYWSMYQLRKTIKSLEDKGLIKSIKANSKKWNHTKWYTINTIEYNKLLKIVSEKNNINNIASPSIIEENSYIAESKENRSTDRSVENQQIIITKNNYTNKSSYKENKFKNYINSIIEKKLEEKINDGIYKKEKGYNKNIDHAAINSEEQEKTKEIAKEMKDKWNEVFRHSSNPINAYVNKSNTEALAQLFQNKFEGDKGKWEEYAKKVNSSQFLMGEKKTKNNFKAVFGWLIKEETVEKILNGEYGVGDREIDMNNLLANIENKKEEVVSKIDKKVSEYIKCEVNEEKERKEFKNYVKDAYTKEEDKYEILKNMRQIPSYTLLRSDEYKKIRESLYESYVMKKYFGKTKLEVRKKIREGTERIIKITHSTDTMKNLRRIENKIEKIGVREWINYHSLHYRSGIEEGLSISTNKESKYLNASSGINSINDLVN